MGLDFDDGEEVPLERCYCDHADSSTVPREEILHEVTKDQTWLALAPVHSPASQYLSVAIPVQVKSSATTRLCAVEFHPAWSPPGLLVLSDLETMAPKLAIVGNRIPQAVPVYTIDKE